LDTSSISFSHAWRILGRGVRAVVQSMKGKEIFDQAEAGQRLHDMFEALTAMTRTCKCCGKVLPGPVSLFCADVDQAFESCHGANVIQAWNWVSSTFTQRFAKTKVQVKKSKKFEYRLGAVPWSRGWWLLDLDHLSRALVMSAAGTFALLGDTVVLLHGMSIGGSMSSSAVAVRFAAEEGMAFKSQQHKAMGFDKLDDRDVQWLRYVDDVLAASRTVCSSCLGQFFKSLYSEPLSVVYSSDVDRMAPCIWLHFELHLVAAGVSWILKNTNRAFLYGNYSQAFIPSFLPWPGALPCHFKQLRATLIGKTALAWSSQLSTVKAVMCLLEVLLELMYLGYPLDLLRALMHSLPKVPAAYSARQIFRSVLKVFGPTPSARWTMGKGVDGRGPLAS